MKSILVSTGIFFLFLLIQNILFFLGEWIISENGLFEFYYLLHPILNLILIVTMLVTIRGFHKNLFKNKSFLWQSHSLKILFLAILLFVICDPFINQFGQREKAYNSLDAVFNAEPKFPTLIRLIGSIVLVPILEESVFRGIILSRLLNSKFSMKSSILVSSIFFSVIHLNFFTLSETWNFGVASFMFSVLVGLIFVRSGSLIACILFHSVYNLLPFTIDQTLSSEYSKFTNWHNFGVMYWLIVVFAALILSFLLKNLNDAFLDEKNFLER